MNEPRPGPGWYSDPSGSGGERWWDGAAWTEHVRGGTSAIASVQGDSIGESDRRWATLAHASALIGLVTGLSAAGPLVVYLLRRDGHPWVREQAAEALNFNLSWLIYLVALSLVAFVLLFVLIGFLVLPVIAVGVLAWLVLVIMAAVRASRGQAFRYPLTIRFVT